MNIAEAEKVLFLKGEYGEEELRKAYRKMIAEYHPDKFATQSDEMKSMAAEKMKEINEANKLLKAQVAGGIRLTVGEHGSATTPASKTSTTTSSTPQTYTYVPPKEGTSVSATPNVKTESSNIRIEPNQNTKPSSPSSSTSSSSSTARKVYSDPVDVSKKPETPTDPLKKKNEGSSTEEPKPKKQKKQKRQHEKGARRKQAKEDFKHPTTVILVIVAIVALVLAVWGIPTLTRSLGVGNAVAGCSWTDVEVVDSGYAQLSDGSTSMAVAVKNNNAEHSLRYVTVKINVYDPAGQMIGTTKIRTSGTALPGGVTYGSSTEMYPTIDPAVGIGRIECAVEENSTSFVDSSPDTYQQELVLGEWTLDPINEIGTRRHLVATASNPNAYAFASTTFDVVFKDAEDHPIYVWSGNGGGVDADGGTVTINADMNSPQDGVWATFMIRPAAAR